MNGIVKVKDGRKIQQEVQQLVTAPMANRKPQPEWQCHQHHLISSAKAVALLVRIQFTFSARNAKICYSSNQKYSIW